MTEAEMARLYIEERKSIPQIAKITSQSYSQARGALLRAGVKFRSPAEGIRLRRDHLSAIRRGKKQGVRTAETRRKISEVRLAWGESNARGVTVKSNGYVEYTRGPHKGRGVHVVKMEERLGRPLRTDEVVHHIDGDRSNNTMNNLALMTRGGHSRLHRREEQLAGKARQRRADGTFT